MRDLAHPLYRARLRCTSAAANPLEYMHACILLLMGKAAPTKSLGAIACPGRRLPHCCARYSPQQGSPQAKTWHTPGLSQPLIKNLSLQADQRAHLIKRAQVRRQAAVHTEHSAVYQCLRASHACSLNGEGVHGCCSDSQTQLGFPSCMAALLASLTAAVPPAERARLCTHAVHAAAGERGERHVRLHGAAAVRQGGPSSTAGGPH